MNKAVRIKQEIEFPNIPCTQVQIDKSYNTISILGFILQKVKIKKQTTSNIISDSVFGL